MIVCVTATPIQAAQNPSFPEASKIAGSWDGIFQCDGYATQFSIKLQALNNQTVTGAMNRSIIGPNFNELRHPYEKSLSLNGKYDAVTGTITLVSGQGRSQEIAFQGIVTPDGDRITGLVKWSKGGACSAVVMGKKFSRDVSHILSQAKPITYRPKVDSRASCDTKVTEWISQPLNYEQYSYQMRGAGGYASLALFEDSRFKPVFGKPYFKMSKKDLAKLENQIARPCWGAVQAIGGQARTATGVLDVVRQKPGLRLNVAIYPYARDIARTWQRVAVTAANSQNQRQVIQFTRAARAFTQVLWPQGEFNFSEQLADKKSAAGTKSMIAALNDLLKPSSPSFEALEALALFEQRVVVGSSSPMVSQRSVSSSRQQNAAATRPRQTPYAEARAEFVVNQEALLVAKKRLAAYINQHIVDAAKRYAAKQIAPHDVRKNLQQLQARKGSNLNTYLSPGMAKRADAIFKDQRDRQAAQFAASEIQAYPQQVKSAPLNMAGLRQLNRYYQSLQSKYGELLNLNIFRNLRNTAAADRQKILVTIQPSVIGQLQNITTIGAIESLIGNTVIAEDRQSQAYAPISQMVVKKRMELAPFTGYPAAEYLNAIYAGDTRVIDAVDSDYRRRLNQSLKEVMGSGGGGLMLNITKLAINKIRIIEPVMATYLLNYEKKYSRCLRSDAAAFTVTTTVPTTVTTNLIGVEIARSEGYTIRDNFRVNKEFESTFRRVGTMKPSGFFASLVDQHLSNGGITAATSGVKKMMNSLDCNSAVLERMEDRMRSEFYR